MTAGFIAGFALVAAAFCLTFAFTVWQAGWKIATTVWAGTFALTALISVGCMLMTGDLG